MAFDFFGAASGSRINKDKCFIIFVGLWRPKNIDYVCGIRVVSSAQRIYGIYFTETGVDSATWNNITVNIKNEMKNLENRRDTIRGRSVLAHVLLLSKIWFAASVTVFPIKYIILWTRLAFKFIWNNRPDKGKITVSIRPISKDGLGCD